MKLQGRSAIITGANQGLGLEIARAFLREGANILICARDGERLNRAADELRSFVPQAGPTVVALSADVSDETAARGVIDRAVAKFGSVDILVNNAGVYGPKGCLEDVDSGDWAAAININLLGPVYLMQHVLPHMKRRGYGKIINLSGGGATGPLPRLSAYAASKAGLVRLTETIAEELRSTGVDINAISPGPLNTRLLDEVLEAGPEKVGKSFFDKAVIQKQRGGAPLTKGAALAVFLASAESDGLTGKLISALWDPWADLPLYHADLAGTDIYTLRRIVPKDRGKAWGDVA